MKVELSEVYLIEGQLAIKLSTFAKIVKYSDSFLLKLFKRLLKKGISLIYKWKRNWYVLLPKTPITISRNREAINRQKPDVSITFPNGKEVEFNWQDVIENSPPAIRTFYLKSTTNFITLNNKLLIVSGFTSNQNSLTLSPKNLTLSAPLSLGVFPATTEYKYGYYITYREDRMSTFDPGENGTLKSTQLPTAFFEVCRALDAAENNRNGANPGLTPRRNISTTVSFDTGTIAVAATIPVNNTIGTGGAINLVASDYLGTPYSTFVNGGGDLSSDTLPEALLEIASLLAAAEKTVTPTENQPNNVQVQFDLETGNATVSANLPFTSSAAANGNVTVIAIDYL